MSLAACKPIAACAGGESSSGGSGMNAEDAKKECVSELIKSVGLAHHDHQ
jgi:hypothetical protein